MLLLLLLSITRAIHSQRTAICITGQSNALATPIQDLEPDTYLDELALTDIGKYNNGIITPALTIKINIFNILTNSGLDVFMMVQNEYNDCDLLFSDLFINNNITNPLYNSFHCIMYEKSRLLTPFIRSFDIWNNYTDQYDKESTRETYLQSLYVLYKCNEAIKSYSITNNIKYSYKISLKANSAVLRPFPILNSKKFIAELYEETTNIKPTCDGLIFYGYDDNVFDWFNIGLADKMDRLLDRYIDFITNPLIHNLLLHRLWNSEIYLKILLNDVYNICLDINDKYRVKEVITKSPIQLIRSSNNHIKAIHTVYFNFYNYIVIIILLVIILFKIFKYKFQKFHI